MSMTLIQTVTVGAGGAASIDFTSIPQTYTDLVLYVSGRSDNASNNWSDGVIAFNGSTASFTNRLLYGTGSSVASASGQPANYTAVNSAATTSNTFGNATIYVPNYTSANNKSASIDAVTENNATSAFAMINASLWSNTAAITSMTLTLAAGNWVQYSSVSLYGIKKGSGGATVS